MSIQVLNCGLPLMSVESYWVFSLPVTSCLLSSSGFWDSVNKPKPTQEIESNLMKQKINSDERINTKYSVIKVVYFYIY